MRCEGGSQEGPKHLLAESGMSKVQNTALQLLGMTKGPDFCAFWSKLCVFGKVMNYEVRCMSGIQEGGCRANHPPESARMKFAPCKPPSN